MQEAMPSPHEDDPFAATERESDPRDETIRLLSEALSEALAELERLTDDQAA